MENRKTRHKKTLMDNPLQITKADYYYMYTIWINFYFYVHDNTELGKEWRQINNLFLSQLYPFPYHCSVFPCPHKEHEKQGDCWPECDQPRRHWLWKQTCTGSRAVSMLQVTYAEKLEQHLPCPNLMQIRSSTMHIARESQQKDPTFLNGLLKTIIRQLLFQNKLS